MAQGNGMSVDGMGSPPSETATFRIGGRDLKVPALTLWDLELNREDMQSLSPQMRWTEYGATVIRIVARKLKDGGDWEPFCEALQRSCSVKEARELSVQFNDLLRVSGFEMGEAEAAVEENPGTGTLTESQPNLPSPSETPTSDTSNGP